MNIVSIRRSACALAIGTLLAMPLRAGVLEEVVVTAQKREQSLQDVGLAVTAFNADELRDMGITSASAITEAIPNVQLSAANGNGNQIITIRGIGLNDFSLNNTPTAAVHIDEVYMASNAMTGFSLFDLDRVEVLKGPQGTLFGRNSTAGVINFILRKPEQEFDGYLEATLGNWETFNVEGAVGGGLTDDVAARLSFRVDQSNEGFQKNRFTGNDHGEVDKWATRLQLDWNINDDAHLLFNIHAGRDQSDAWLPTFEGVNDGAGGVCASGASGQPNPNECFSSAFDILTSYSDTDGDPHKGDFDFEPEIDDTFAGGSVRLDWDFEAFTLTSITGYENYEYIHGEETDGTPLFDPTTGDVNANGINIIHRVDDYEITQYSQEIRLTSSGGGNFNWILGMFLAKEEGEEDQVFVSDVLQLAFEFPDNLFPLIYKQDATVVSLFAHTDWQLADAWKLTVGARYAEENKEYTGDNVFVDFGVEAVDIEDDWNNYAWKVGLDYTPADDLLFYGSVSRGFKAGGIPGVPPTDGIDQLAPYDSETVIAYEVGFKTTWPDQALRVNGALFYYDYQDMQGIVRSPGAIAEGLDNFGDVEVQGAELDLQWSPGEGFDIRVGAGWLDTEIVESDGLFTDALGGQITLEGNETAQAPDFSANAMVRYEFAVADGLLLALQADVQYKTEYFLRLDNHPSYEQSDDVTVVGARATLADEAQRWSLSVWGKNLNDEEYRQYGNFSLDPRDHILWYNMPRSYGATLAYHFD
ncbi:MAG: TonB-dependent receptor [Pseudomonadales bacterium]